jgi:hypothetical protein
MKKVTNFQICAVIAFILIVSMALMSCTSGSGNPRVSEGYINANDTLMRVRIVENNVTTYIRVHPPTAKIYNVDDTVMVNPFTHGIDNVDTNTLRAVILPDIHHSFRDGEGNELPEKAVRLLVMSQYVILDASEKEYLHKYFHLTN